MTAEEQSDDDDSAGNIIDELSKQDDEDKVIASPSNVENFVIAPNVHTMEELKVKFYLKT